MTTKEFRLLCNDRLTGRNYPLPSQLVGLLQAALPALR